eukprot:8592130-Karenia_brevis.AAC.1
MPAHYSPSLPEVSRITGAACSPSSDDIVYISSELLTSMTVAVSTSLLQLSVSNLSSSLVNRLRASMISIIISCTDCARSKRHWASLTTSAGTGCCAAPLVARASAP